MATNYPSSKENLGGTDIDGTADKVSQDVNGRTHSEMHNDVNDTVDELQDKVGTGASTPSGNTVLKGTGTGTSTWAATTGADTEIVSGTAGSDTEFVQWNSDGDAVSNSLTPSGADSSVITGTAGSDQQPVAWNSDGDAVGNDSPHMVSPQVSTAILDANGNEVIEVGSTGSAVNHARITNQATGNDTLLDAAGADTNVGLRLKGKGTGQVQIGDAELSYPDSDGTNGQFMQTDGSGNLSFGDASVQPRSVITLRSGEALSDGDAVRTSDAPSQSLDLEDSNSDYVSISDGSQTGLDLSSGDFTIELWVKWETVQSDILVSKHAPNNGYEITYDNTGNEIKYGAKSSSNLLTRAGFSFTPSADTWYHFAFVWDSSTGEIEVFQDGSSLGTSTNPPQPGSNSIEFAIGASSGGGSHHDGEIADCRVWSEKRTSSQVSDYRNRVINGIREDNINAFWKFDGTLTDETSNNNDLSYQGGSSVQYASNTPIDGVSLIYKTDANFADSIDDFIGFANASISEDATGNVAVAGVAAGLSGISSGKTYYLQDTPGTIGTSAGSNSKKVGLGISSSEILIKHDNA